MEIRLGALKLYRRHLLDQYADRCAFYSLRDICEDHMARTVVMLTDGAQQVPANNCDCVTATFVFFCSLSFAPFACNLAGTLLHPQGPITAGSLQIFEASKAPLESPWCVEFPPRHQNRYPGGNYTPRSKPYHRDAGSFLGGHRELVSFPRTTSTPHAGSPRGQHGERAKEPLCVRLLGLIGQVSQATVPLMIN